jgi:hypothetical protein
VGCVVEMAAEISHPRHERHIVPDTWVNTFRVNTFRLFCGREVWMRFAGSGTDERCVPGFRHIRIPAGFCDEPNALDILDAYHHLSGD